MAACIYSSVYQIIIWLLHYLISFCFVTSSLLYRSCINCVGFNLYTVCKWCTLESVGRLYMYPLSHSQCLSHHHHTTCQKSISAWLLSFLTLEKIICTKMSSYFQGLEPNISSEPKSKLHLCCSCLTKSCPLCPCY